MLNLAQAPWLRQYPWAHTWQAFIRLGSVATHELGQNLATLQFSIFSAQKVEYFFVHRIGRCFYQFQEKE